MQAVAPAGWPAQVRPPSAPDWERTARGWLLDHSPPEFRCYPVLQRHLVVLARFTAVHQRACHAAARDGLAEARTALRDVSDPETIQEALDTWQRELVRAESTLRAVELVEEALRGRRFRPRL